MFKHILFLILIVLIASNTEATTPTTAITTADSLNVREHPNGKVITTLPKKTVVVILEVRDSWALILFYQVSKNINAKFNGKYGWVSMRYLNISTPREEYVEENKEDNEAQIRFSTGTHTREIDFINNSNNCNYVEDIDTEICLSFGKEIIRCNKSINRDHYKSCEVSIKYEASSRQPVENSNVGIDFWCSLSVKSKKEDSRWHSVHSQFDKKLEIGPYETIKDSVDFYYSFAYYSKVTFFKVESLNCGVSRAYKIY